MSTSVGADRPRPATPQVVDLRVWRVTTAATVSAMARVGYQRWSLRKVPGLRFAKLLGTGSGRSFTPGDADLHHWALLTVFDDVSEADEFDDSTAVRSWRRVAREELRVRMSPLSSVGSWAGQQPFDAPVPHRWDGPVAAITRAQIKPHLWRRFWSAVPPVVLDLSARDGLLVRMGIGEAPVGLQGTFSIWRTNQDLTAFAYRSPAHQQAIDQTHDIGWYSEELFARFAVTEVRGTINGRDPLASLVVPSGTAEQPR